MSDVILRLNDVTKQFGGLTAVDHANIQVRNNTVHSLIGPNGAGKTTIVNLITGVLPLTSGEITFEDKRISGLKTYQIARRGIGRTFQNIKVFPTMTLLENVMVGGHPLTKIGMIRGIFDFRGTAAEERMLKEKAEMLLDRLGMYELRNETMKNLPYGRQKISEIARAMMTDPKLILLDEPAAGLNPSERAYLVSVIQRTHADGYTFFLIEHNMDVVMNLSDDISVLSFGKLIAKGTPAEIKDNDEVIEAYLGSAFVKEKKEQEV